MRKVRRPGERPHPNHPSYRQRGRLPAQPLNINKSCINKTGPIQTLKSI
jgi:hypothetical protein